MYFGRTSRIISAASSRWPWPVAWTRPRPSRVVSAPSRAAVSSIREIDTSLPGMARELSTSRSPSTIRMPFISPRSTRERALISSPWVPVHSTTTCLGWNMATSLASMNGIRRRSPLPTFSIGWARSLASRSLNFLPPACHSSTHSFENEPSWMSARIFFMRWRTPASIRTSPRVRPPYSAVFDTEYHMYERPPCTSSFTMRFISCMTSKYAISGW